MGITTKKGDKGMTSLYRGKRVPKDDIRIDICGDMDELCSYLGMAKSKIKDRRVKMFLASLQKDIFILNAEIVTEPGFAGELRKRIDCSCVRRLESYISDMEKKARTKKRSFLVPGVNFISSVLDVARTVARRAERKVVTLRRKNMLKNESILVYLNRFSDLLFLLAREYEGKGSKAKK